MHEHAEFVSFEIDTVIADSKPVENASAAFQFAKFIQFGAAHLLWKAAKFAKDLQLKFLGHSRQFSGAGRREDDLKSVHFS